MMQPRPRPAHALLLVALLAGSTKAPATAPPAVTILPEQYGFETKNASFTAEISGGAR